MAHRQAHTGISPQVILRHADGGAQAIGSEDDEGGGGAGDGWERLFVRFKGYLHTTTAVGAPPECVNNVWRDYNCTIG